MGDLAFMPVNTKWFVHLLEDKKISQRQLASSIGIDASALSLMLRGKRKMSVEEAGKIAVALKVGITDVLRQAGIEVPNVKGAGQIKVVGWVDDEWKVHKEKPAGPQIVDAPAGLDDACEALRFQTTGAFDGWLLFYRPSEGVAPDIVGRMCLVKIAGSDELLVRQVRRGYEPGHYGIGSGNHEKIENVRLECATPILWMKQ